MIFLDQIQFQYSLKGEIQILCFLKHSELKSWHTIIVSYKHLMIPENLDYSEYYMNKFNKTQMC